MKRAGSKHGSLRRNSSKLEPDLPTDPSEIVTIPSGRLVIPKKVAMTNPKLEAKHALLN